MGTTDVIDEMYSTNRYNHEAWKQGKCIACHGYGHLSVYVGCNCVREKPYESITCSVCGGDGKAKPPPEAQQRERQHTAIDHGEAQGVHAGRSGDDLSAVQKPSDDESQMIIERSVLCCLVEAWESWMKLKSKHLMDDQEFCTKIHDLQRMVAMRQARRADPKTWPLDEKGG